MKKGEIPVRVQVALQLCEQMQRVVSGCGCSDGRKLVDSEMATYRAALETVRLFMTGEIAAEPVDAVPHSGAATKA